MRKHKLSCADVAGKIWITRQAVQLYTAGKRAPGEFTRLALEKISGGEIPRTGW